MPTDLPGRTLRRQHAGVSLLLIAALSACVAGQDEAPPAAPTPAKTTTAPGEIVSELPKDLWHVFQAKDSCHWFASRTEGAFRFDGTTITRFSSKDGLPCDQVGVIQEDQQGNLFFNTDRGISKFDGRSFTTLEPLATGEWKKQPHDLWFYGGQNFGVVYRYDGRSLHRLALPETEAGDRHYAEFPRSRFPNANFSPYDVYSITKDSHGNLWFGTAVLGACRYDGESFGWVPEEVLQNGSFGTRSIIEDGDGMFWFSNTLHRYAIADSAAADPDDGSRWFEQERGLGDLGEHRQSEYRAFMSGTRGADGALWLAILGGVVWRYDGTTMTPYPVTENGERHWIYSIYRDSQDVLWLGTQAHGVYRFNGTAFEKFRPST